MDNNNMMNNGGFDFNQQQFDQQSGQSPYQQGYPQNNIYAQPGENRSKAKEILSLVFGILAILISCCYRYLGIGLGIAGLVMAVLAKDDNNGKMPGMAIGGMICSIFAIVICGVCIILALIGAVTGDLTNYLIGI